MPLFLSADWIASANTLLGQIPSLDVGEPLVIQQNVSDHRGDSSYHMVFDRDGARLVGGAATGPDVVFTLDYDTAAAVAQGRVSAQAAFQNGALEVSGDMAALVAHRALVATCDDALAPLRTATTYDRTDA
ncbi:MAG: SCP2 sterol-binding domain-containing protein [Acidimicrobiales bacterium]